MQQLFTPDMGLMIWTAVTFLLLLTILARFGWRPLIKSIEDRERRLQEERVAAEKARAEAQRIQVEMQAQLAAMDAKAKELMAKVSKEAEALRASHTAEAQSQAQRLMEKTRADLDEEKRKLVVQLRSEVAALAVTAAEKLIHKSVDDGVRKSVLDQFLKDLDHNKLKH